MEVRSSNKPESEFDKYSSQLSDPVEGLRILARIILRQLENSRQTKSAITDNNDDGVSKRGDNNLNS